MHASSFINSEGDSINAYQYEALPLYFGSRNGTSLTKQMRNVHYASDDSLEKLVVEQLIAGRRAANLLQLCRLIRLCVKSVRRGIYVR